MQEVEDEDIQRKVSNVKEPGRDKSKRMHQDHGMLQNYLEEQTKAVSRAAVAQESMAKAAILASQATATDKALAALKTEISSLKEQLEEVDDEDLLAKETIKNQIKHARANLSKLAARALSCLDRDD